VRLAADDLFSIDAIASEPGMMGNFPAQARSSELGAPAVSRRPIASFCSRNGRNVLELSEGTPARHSPAVPAALFHTAITNFWSAPVGSE